MTRARAALQRPARGRRRQAAVRSSFPHASGRRALAGNGSEARCTRVSVRERVGVFAHVVPWTPERPFCSVTPLEVPCVLLK